MYGIRKENKAGFVKQSIQDSGSRWEVNKIKRMTSIDTMKLSETAFAGYMGSTNTNDSRIEHRNEKKGAKKKAINAKAAGITPLKSIQIPSGKTVLKRNGKRPPRKHSLSKSELLSKRLACYKKFEIVSGTDDISSSKQQSEARLDGCINDTVIEHRAFKKEKAAVKRNGKKYLELKSTSTGTLFPGNTRDVFQSNGEHEVHQKLTCKLTPYVELVDIFETVRDNNNSKENTIKSKKEDKEAFEGRSKLRRTKKKTVVDLRADSIKIKSTTETKTLAAKKTKNGVALKAVSAKEKESLKIQFPSKKEEDDLSNLEAGPKVETKKKSLSKSKRLKSSLEKGEISSLRDKSIIEKKSEKKDSKYEGKKAMKAKITKAKDK